MIEIGFTCSTFDLLHPGHVVLIRSMMEHCEEVWVGLQTSIPDRPEKNKPVQTVYERFVQLEALGVAKIIPYESEDDLLNLLKTIPPHARFTSYEYYGKPYTGKELYAERLMPLDEGEKIFPGDVVYLPRDHTWSTSELRRRVAEEENKKGLEIAAWK